jgi:hypothetical protein
MQPQALWKSLAQQSFPTIVCVRTLLTLSEVVSLPISTEWSLFLHTSAPSAEGKEAFEALSGQSQDTSWQ